MSEREVPGWVTAGGFRGDYSPGGLTGRSRMRAQRRWAAKASARKRRQLARARRGLKPGHGQLSAPLSYEPRQLSRREYLARYEKLRPRPEWPAAAVQWERRREAVWAAHMSSWRLVSACGQHVRTTNGQRGSDLSSRGLPRDLRSIQRYHRDLEALGVARFSHVRKPQGQKDCLCVEWRVHRRVRQLPVIPPSGTTNYGASPQVVCRRTAEIAPTARAVPPDGGDERQAASRPGSERERVEAELRFQQLKLELGFGPQGQVRLQIDRLRATLERGPAPSPHEGSDGLRI